MQEATAAAHASLVHAKKSTDATQPQDNSFGIPAWDENLKAGAWAGYILQVGSFRDRSRADALFQDILDAGHRAFLEATVLPTGETAYRVRVGPFADLETAQEAAAEIETQSSHRALILSPS
jgi:cell division septation protein DedD